MKFGGYLFSDDIDKLEETILKEETIIKDDNSVCVGPEKNHVLRQEALHPVIDVEEISD